VLEHELSVGHHIRHWVQHAVYFLTVLIKPPHFHVSMSPAVHLPICGIAKSILVIHLHGKQVMIRKHSFDARHQLSHVVGRMAVYLAHKPKTRQRTFHRGADTKIGHAEEFLFNSFVDPRAEVCCVRAECAAPFKLVFSQSSLLQFLWKGWVAQNEFGKYPRCTSRVL
jgi:hypothetical protein